MTRIEKEKEIIEVMIRLYCRRKLHAEQLPSEYAELLAYARRRLDMCRFGEHKSACRRCPVHCYAKDKRQLMRQVMRWCGPPDDHIPPAYHPAALSLKIASITQGMKIRRGG